MIYQWLYNDEQVKQLLKMATKARQNRYGLPSSVILSGPAGLGKRQAALAFAMSLFCQSSRDQEPCRICQICRQVTATVFPDLTWLEREPDKKFIDIDSVRAFIDRLNLSSMSDGYRLGVIAGAEGLNASSANALLKTLEEPSAKAAVIMLVDNIDTLPRTIVSRSQVFIFRPAPAGLILDHLLADGLERGLAKTVTALSGGRPALAKQLAENKQQLDDLINFAKPVLNAPGADIGERLRGLNELLALVGQLTAAKAGEILSLWLSLSRDWLAASTGASDLVNHLVWAREIDNAADKLGRKGSLAALRKFGQAKLELAANVNPKTVLENAIINFDL